MNGELDVRVRTHVYDVTISEGVPPSIEAAATALGVTEEDVRESLARLAEGRSLVVQRNGEVLMANPFSAVPTGFAVQQENRFSYGNCIWDAMGILAMTAEDGSVETSCGDCGTEMGLRVSGGEIEGDVTGLVHFAIPARHWWDDIVFN